MCNAYNHSWDCPCGFGGDTGGASGRRSFSAVHNFVSVYDVLERPISGGWAKDKRGTVESYVNPNAHCPVCRELVYFYRSPYNGRVFFDELGWPWPKHRCTDYPREPLRATRESAGEKGPRPIPQWRVDGWRPVLSAKAYADGDRQRITGDIDDKFRELLLPVGESADADAPVLVRAQASHPLVFDITFLRSDAFGVRERKTIGFDPRISAIGEDVIAGKPLGNGLETFLPEPNRGRSRKLWDRSSAS